MAESRRLDRSRPSRSCEARQARRRHPDARDRRLGLRRRGQSRSKPPSNNCVRSSGPVSILRSLSLSAFERLVLHVHLLAPSARSHDVVRRFVDGFAAPSPLPLSCRQTSPAASPVTSLPDRHRHLLERAMVPRPATECFSRRRKSPNPCRPRRPRAASTPISSPSKKCAISGTPPLAIKPLNGFKVDVCSDFPPREGQKEAQQVAITSRLQPLSAWAEEWKPGGAITPPRGFAFAAYQLSPRQLLLVYALHLKSNRGDIREDMRIREESMLQLRSHMKAMEQRLRQTRRAHLDRRRRFQHLSGRCPFRLRENRSESARRWFPLGLGRNPVRLAHHRAGRRALSSGLFRPHLLSRRHA